jgi:hypothetical protein
MAIVLVESKAYPIGEFGVIVIGTFTGEASYPTGGSTLASPANQYEALWFSGSPAGYIPVWDKPNNKLKMYYSATLLGLLSEVTVLTNMAGSTFDFVAIRPS